MEIDPIKPNTYGYQPFNAQHFTRPMTPSESTQFQNNMVHAISMLMQRLAQKAIKALKRMKDDDNRR